MSHSMPGVIASPNSMLSDSSRASTVSLDRAEEQSTNRNILWVHLLACASFSALFATFTDIIAMGFEQGFHPGFGGLAIAGAVTAVCFWAAILAFRSFFNDYPAKR